MECQRCSSNRIAILEGKLMTISYQGLDYQGELTEDSTIGCFNAISFDYCLECGQIQGEFPEKVSHLPGPKKPGL